MTHKRFDEKPIFANFYFLFLYLLPLSLFLKDLKKPFAISCVFAFGLSFLSTYWSTAILIFQCYKQRPKGAFILFKKKLCRTEKEKSGIESFLFEKKKMLLVDGLVVPLEPKTALSFEQIRKGVPTKNYSLYPRNRFEVPKPGFLSMFKEQCVSPLFCFQIFSSLLMCFDEHVMNSLMSTAMIVFVEASFVMSRVATMKIFRRLEHKSCTVKRLVRGDGTVESTQVESTELRPGDRIVINSLVDIPCDLVIVEGTCAVNEAMLSGESVPLFKEELAVSNEVLCLNKHRKHVLFAGTSLEKLYSPLTCVVLRTGYSTEQGMLLSKMLISEEIKYDPEALRFILLLSATSIINCAFTFKYSKKTGYALFIDLIILFTNSIPFELPMEMGMSIQTAVKNLMTKKIYCLEPFRITLAGKVDLCCFDKTGTLVDSKLEVKKLEHRGKNTDRVLSCCHNLITVDGSIKGDPLEIAVYSSEFTKVPYKLVHQFSFSSELKRQGVLVEFEDTKNKMAFCLKGAPETIKKYLKDVPEHYEEYKTYAAQGYRVIALAYREISIHDMKLSQVGYAEDRTRLEREMQFCGFLLLGSSLRDYAQEMCQILTTAGLKILMITGDNLLTAMNVAEQLKIKGKGVEGKDIEKVLGSTDFEEYTIFGRADPAHKEMIVKKYQKSGYHAMMVGDGTNDVGALKAADVGVAMLESEELVFSKENKPLSLVERFKEESMAQQSIKPGDASMAAPFTVKSNSLRSVVEIIQQGRSSLVTTIQMYKILALNSIINAFFYMFVDIAGVKFSDYQMVSIGVLSAIAFTAITQPKTLNTISRQRPVTSIFSLYFFSSVLLQSVVQVSSMWLVFKNVPVPSPGVSFEPSVLNTVLFVSSSVSTVATLLCNYIGRPFREDLVENKVLGLSLLAIVGFIANIFLNFHSDINNLIQVVDIQKHAYFVVSLSISVVLLCYISEKISFKLFMIK